MYMNNWIRLGLIAILIISTGLVAMPQDWKEKIPGEGFRNFLLSRDISYGLDLAGGSQLDFKVDMTRVREKIAAGEDITEEQIINGVKATLQRRIDPDGTRELNIFASDFESEKHIFVELTADIDTPETRAKLQKHIDLQFKEPKTETGDDELNTARVAAEQALTLAQEGVSFSDIATQLSAVQDSGYVILPNEGKKVYADQLGENVSEKLFALPAGTLFSEVTETDGGYMFDQNSANGLVKLEGFSIYRVGEKESVDRTRTEQGEDFAEVAAEISESEERDIPVDVLPDDLKRKVLVNLTPQENLSEVMEYEGKFYVFQLQGQDEENTGAHVLQMVTSTQEAADAAHARVDEQVSITQEDQLTIDEIFVVAQGNQWQETGLDGQNFKIAKVAVDEIGMPIVSIDFDDEGAQKFAELTKRLVGKPMAIFVGGDFISSPIIQEEITGGSAQITLGAPTYIEAQQEAYKLAQDLNAGAIPAPVSLEGELKVAASLGADALEKSFLAGMIGLALLSLWLIFAYRLLGVFAVVSLSMYGTLLFFILKFSPIFVLTLAGVAGIILSIGMAVDANVLIFERMREELRSGKNFSASLAIGFDRAWTSIRDANLTTLIVCGILFVLGTSIVKGFATMLAMGVLLSMFTAVVITRALLKMLVGTKFARKKGAVTKL